MIKNQENKPLISVILPVYNGEMFLAESILSILEQSYNNIELIIINDGSNDSSEKVIFSFKDERIIYIKNPFNLGLAKTLNIGIKKSSGKYIARQDQDDISESSRLDIQYKTLLDNNIDFVGSNALIINERGDVNSRHEHPLSYEAISIFALFDNPFVHSSIFAKKTLLLENLYSEDSNRQPPEDFELWSRILPITRASNIRKSLVRYRDNNIGMSKTENVKIKNNIILIVAENLTSRFKFLNQPTANNLAKLYHNKIDACSFKFFIQSMVVLIKIYINEIWIFKKINIEMISVMNYQISKILFSFIKLKI